MDRYSIILKKPIVVVAFWELISRGLLCGGDRCSHIEGHCPISSPRGYASQSFFRCLERKFI